MRLIATPQNLQDVWKQANGGDTLILQGEFRGWAPRERVFETPLTIDATEAKLFDFYGRKLAGINFEGGLWKPSGDGKTGLRIDGAERIGVRGATFEGGDLTTGEGLRLYGGSDLTLEDLSASGSRIGLVTLRAQNIAARRLKFRRLGSDGFDLHNVQNVLIEDVDSDETLLIPGAHGDIIQMATKAGYERCRNIVIRRVKGRGDTQGITLFANSKTPKPAGEDITVEGCDLAVTHKHGISLYHVDRPKVLDNKVHSVPGARSQAIIYLPGCENVTRSGNTVGEHTNPSGRHFKAQDDPDAKPVPPPPAAEEPQEIRIDLKPGQRLVVTGVA